MVETNTPLLVADKLLSAVVVALPVALVMLAGGVLMVVVTTETWISEALSVRIVIRL
jgi:hypothetical protein